MTHDVDCVVVGAGVVGLAAARALAQAGRDTLIVEAAAAIGTGISSRNSEVIHAGIYYPPGSLKARLCVDGRRRLYDYCAARGIAHRKCGKLIVATRDDQLDDLVRIRTHAAANGVDDLVELDATDARAIEPALSCRAALLSPDTGIVDSHALMLALLGDAESAGATLALRSPVVAGRVGADGVELSIGGDAPVRLRTRLVVNCAGLDAPRVAAAIEGFPSEHVPRQWLARGNYFALAGRAPFSRLIYPVPEPGGLGVHLTLDLGGQARFGPDVEWIDTIDYGVAASRGARFYDEVRRYWPGLADGALTPAFAGIRPKLSGPGAPAADFQVAGPRTHGTVGIVHLFGIESPGLTSSLAIADAVLEAADP